VRDDDSDRFNITRYYPKIRIDIRLIDAWRKEIHHFGYTPFCSQFFVFTHRIFYFRDMKKRNKRVEEGG